MEIFRTASRLYQSIFQIWIASLYYFTSGYTLYTCTYLHLDTLSLICSLWCMKINIIFQKYSLSLNIHRRQEYSITCSNRVVGFRIFSSKEGGEIRKRIWGTSHAFLCYFQSKLFRFSLRGVFITWQRLKSYEHSLDNRWIVNMGQ